MAKQEGNFMFDRSKFEKLSDLFTVWNEELEMTKEDEGEDFDEAYSIEIFALSILDCAVELLEVEKGSIISLFQISLDDIFELSTLYDMLDEKEQYVEEKTAMSNAVVTRLYEIIGIRFVVGSDHNGNHHLFLSEQDFDVFNKYVQSLDLREEY